jgi:hypothetical protein
MNNILNKEWLELLGLLSGFSTSVQRIINDKVKSIVELEQKNVQNLQLLTIRAFYLRKGDLVLNLDTKRTSKVKYCDYRINCQFNIEKGNKEILVEYTDDTAIDYYNENTELVLLVDVADLVNIHRREEPNWDEVEEF